MMRFNFDTRSADDYETFLQIRRCPMYSFHGTSAIVPDEYAAGLGVKLRKKRAVSTSLHSKLFDYQHDITAMAIRKQKYAIFADCGLGKTMMILEFARHAMRASKGKVLIVAPLNQIAASQAYGFADAMIHERSKHCSDCGRNLSETGGGTCQTCEVK